MTSYTNYSGGKPAFATGYSLHPSRGTKCNRVHALSQFFIDKQKQSALDFINKRNKDNRIAMWNRKHKEIKAICTEVAMSYAFYRHYLSFTKEDVEETFKHISTISGLRVGRKIFTNATAERFGMREAEYHQVEDADGNIIRRPFWHKIGGSTSEEVNTEVISMYKKYGLLKDNNYYMESIEKLQDPKLVANIPDLRSGEEYPIMREEFEDVLHTWIGPNPLAIALKKEIHRRARLANLIVRLSEMREKNRRLIRQGTSLCATLDRSRYNNTRVKTVTETRSQNMKDISVQVTITEYLEHSLLIKNPMLIYIRKSYSVQDINYDELYDDNMVLMETIMTNTTTGESEWITISDITTLIKTVINDGLSVFKSMVISKKDTYEAEIDAKNHLTVKTACDEVSDDNTYGYKAAMTKDGKMCLVKLKIPKEAKVASSAHAGGKLRANTAIPVGIILVDLIPQTSNENKISSDDVDNDIDDKICSDDKKYYVDAKLYELTDNAENTIAVSCVYTKEQLEYKLGETINCHNFYHHMDEVCKPGIHFCVTQREAIEFHLRDGQVLNNASY